MDRVKSILIKTIVEIARLLLGITFIFSGFVKSVDPMGTAYKIQDYMTNFNLVDLHSFALPVSIFLCASEFCLGVFMLLGLYRKWTSILLLVVMLFMTPLTLYIAIANPVKDCGCFGDALIITNWQTFIKNIILLFCAICTVIWHQRITNFFTGKFYWLVALYIIICSIAFCLYNYIYEPIIDFRPYKIGSNIPEQMTVDDDKKPVFENIFIYEKSGVEQEFTEANYPWSDSSWTFVKMETKLLKEGEEPKIADLSINRLYLNTDKTEVISKEDMTQEILSDSTYTFLMISYDLNSANEEYFSRFEDVNNYAKDYHYKFYCLTASTEQSILNLEQENITNFIFCQTDERVLKTIVRSNPGLLLIKDGVILNKWSGSDVPDEQILNKSIEEISIANIEQKSTTDTEKMKNILLIFIVPILALKILDIVFFQRKKVNEVNK